MNHTSRTSRCMPVLLLIRARANFQLLLMSCSLLVVVSVLRSARRCVAVPGDGARSGAPCASAQHSNGTGATPMNMAAVRHAEAGAVVQIAWFGGGSRARAARHHGHAHPAPVGAPQPG